MLVAVAAAHERLGQQHVKKGYGTRKLYAPPDAA